MVELDFIFFNLFIPNAPFLYSLKTSENLTVSWYFQGVEKGCIGSEWIKVARVVKLKLVFTD